LPVKEGDWVEKGDLLLKINPDLYLSAVNRAEAALNTARSNMSSAKAQVLQAEANMTLAKQQYDRNKKLFSDKVISAAEFEASESQFEIAKANLESAKESVRASEFSIKSAEATVREATDNLKRTTILAPQSGTVTALAKEVGESVMGTGMMAGEIVMKVSDLRAMQVNVEVNESDIIRVNVGDTATVEVDAFLNRQFKGVVTEIGNTALNAMGAGVSMDQVTNFSVKIKILPESYADLQEGKAEDYSPLRPGMSATVDIRTARRENALSIPVKAVTSRLDTTSMARSRRTADTESENTKPILCVFVKDGDKAKIKAVETGIQDSRYIEVLSGLTEQDELLTGPYDAISRYLRNGSRIRIDDKGEKEQ
jgi:HlyD family secretion protein